MKTLWLAAITVMGVSLALCGAANANPPLCTISVETHFTTNLPGSNYLAYFPMDASVHSQTVSDLYAVNNTGSQHDVSLAVGATISGPPVPANGIGAKSYTLHDSESTDVYCVLDTTQGEGVGTHTFTCEVDGHEYNSWPELSTGSQYGTSVDVHVTN